MEKQENIVVSIICLTYNHEKYIKKALDGFVMQKTNFEYEVIVHDDASIDNTAKIIMDYARKNRNIKPIFQKENQYSKGISIEKEYVFPLVKGTFIAFCEGDDYWTDSNKLQKMYDYMKKNPDCSMCCHAYRNVNANTEEELEIVRTLSSDGIIDVEQAILYINPPQVASQMFRKEVVVNQPDLFFNRGIGDYTLYLFSAISGKMYYMNNVMTNHRVGSDGSWTNRVSRNRPQFIKHCKDMIDFLMDLNAFTQNKYIKHIESKLNDYRVQQYLAEHNFYKLLNRHFFCKLSYKRKCLVFLGVINPYLASKLYDKKYFQTY